MWDDECIFGTKSKRGSSFCVLNHLPSFFNRSLLESEKWQRYLSNEEVGSADGTQMYHTVKQIVEIDKTKSDINRQSRAKEAQGNMTSG